MTKSKRGLVASPNIMIFAAIVILGGLGYLASRMGWLSCCGPVPQSQNTVETADWKTYRNRAYSFKVSYPPTITPKVISQSNNGILRLEVSFGEVNLTVAETAYSLDEQQKAFSSANFTVEQIDLGGGKAIKATHIPPFSSYYIYTIRDGLVYSLSAPVDNIVAEKILSTFQFAFID